jgi:hypothetical protein
MMLRAKKHHLLFGGLQSLYLPPVHLTHVPMFWCDRGFATHKQRGNVAGMAPGCSTTSNFHFLLFRASFFFSRKFSPFFDLPTSR